MQDNAEMAAKQAAQKIMEREMKDRMEKKKMMMEREMK